MELTSHERIMRIFANREVDRPALKLWGASPFQSPLDPRYAPVCELARQKSDYVVCASSPFDIYFGKNRERQTQWRAIRTPDPCLIDEETIFRTPLGDLREVKRVSTIGEPSFIIEHLVKEPEDIDKLLSIPYQPQTFYADDYFKKTMRMGDRGVVLFGIEHAAYALYRVTGSENLAYFSIDCRDKVLEAMRVFSERITHQLRRALNAGIRGPYHWVGPELFIPPLLSPKDFDEFVFDFDKPLCDDIHDAGGYVWVHCHGKVASFINRFIDMGVDVLNPLEPPKNGDIDLEQTVDKFGNAIGLEGNIEIQDLFAASEQSLKQLIDNCVSAGAPSGRFILCQSAGFMEYPDPTERYIRNLMTYLEYGHECVCRYKNR